MLKSLIQLNLQRKQDKSQYQIKKNKIILLKNKQLVFNNINSQSQSQSIVGANINKRIQAKNINSSVSSNIRSSQHNQQLKQVNFDWITYDYKSTNQKILFQLLMVNNDKKINDNNKQSLEKSIKLTVTFNYDIEYQKLQQLIIQLMEIKKFQSSNFEIAHFQLRNNHVSDYNKSHTHHHNTSNITNNTTNKIQPDQMDNFTKQIDTCIKLDKTYNIKDNINFKSFNRENYKNKDILNKNSRTNYDKKTNQFFILNIDQIYQLNVIVFHRQKDYVLTKTEDKQIQQAFVLYKGQSQKGVVKLQFTTSLAQILQSFLNQSNEVIFISQYPTLNQTITLHQQLHLPILIDPTNPSSIQQIIQQYNKQKQSKLQIQMQKMKVKLRQLKHKRKTTQQNITYLMKKYKKGFENIFDSLNYLKKNNIHDIKAYKDNLEIQIKQKQQDIKDTLQQLKQINLDMIQSSQRNQYFTEKMQTLKQNLQQDLDDIEISYTHKLESSKVKVRLKQQQDSLQTSLGSVRVTKNIISSHPNLQAKQFTRKQINSTKSNINAQQKQNKQSTSLEISQTILKKFLEVQETSHNPFEVQMQRQVQKYTNQLRQRTRQRLIKSQQVDEFHNVMDQLRKRLSKHQFTKLQQKYLALISMC